MKICLDRVLLLLLLLTTAGCNQEATRDPTPSPQNAAREIPMNTAPYGTWTSPISAAMTAGSSNGILSLQLDGDDLYWWETRPLEGGRYVLMKYNTTGSPEELTPSGYNVRTRVHEYGGTSYLIVGGTAYFSNFADQALYQQQPGSAPTRLSISDGLRYADCAHDATHNRLLCVREDHRGSGEAVNAVVAIDLAGEPNDGEVLWQQSDFVAYPRISPDGKTLAWTSWDHPNMPWDNVALWVAPVNADGSLGAPTRLNRTSDGAIDESVLQPVWAEDGTLYFLADRSGWWILLGLIPIIGNLILLWWYIQAGSEGDNQFGPPAQLQA